MVGMLLSAVGGAVGLCAGGGCCTSGGGHGSQGTQAQREPTVSHEAGAQGGPGGRLQSQYHLNNKHHM